MMQEPQRTGDDRPILDCQALEDWLSRVRTAPVQELDGLRISPVVRDTPPIPADLLAPEAIRKGWLEVRESGGGTVQELEAENLGRRPVLLLEGETLVGGKQDRVVAYTVIIAPGATVTVPVGCMEQGRWSRGAGLFDTAPVRAEAGLRAQTVRETSQARRTGKRPSLQQGRLWEQVGSRLSKLGVDSPTSSYRKLLESRCAAVEDVCFVPVARQVGLVALWEEQLLGIEMVADARTWQTVALRTIGGYRLAVQSIECGAWPERRQPIGGASPADWMLAVRKARMRTRPGLGLGTNLELEGRGFNGSGLWYDASLKHLAVFPEN